MNARIIQSRMVSVFLILSLLCGMGLPMPHSRVFAAGGDLLADTFDTAALGQRPPGWSGNPPPAASPAPGTYTAKAAVEELQGYPGRLLLLQKSAKSTATYQLERQVGGVQSAKTLLAYKVRAEQTDAVVYLPSPKSGTVAAAKFALVNGRFAYMKKGAAAWTELIPYSSGEWYEVKLSLNADEDTFDLYINQEQLLSREPMTEAGLLTSFYMGIYKDSAARVYFDDFHVHSYKPAAGAAFARPQYQVAAGSEQRLELVFDPVDATDQSARWSSDRPEVAWVTGSGVVKGLSAGTAVITAAPTESVPPVSVTVSVYEIPVTGIAIAPVDAGIPAGSRTLLSWTVSPDSSTNKQLTWSSSQPQVAEVDAYGEVTGIGPGSAVIRAVSPDGNVSGEVQVTVVPRTVQHELYVSAEGSDVQPGTLAAPFRTLERAQAKVRELNAAMTGDIVVYLRGGTYSLAAPLRFGPEDSGTGGHFVTYRSYPGEEAVLSGGRQITGWTEHDAAAGIYRSAVGPGLATRQLFVDGIRAIRARSTGGLTNPVKTSGGYTSGDTFLAGWRNPSDLEFVYHEVWTNPRAHVAGVTTADGQAQITMEEPGWHAIANKGMTSATVPVYYENAYELLDEPGEWYYDAAAGMLYYKPRSWEQLDTAAVTAPILEQLMTVRGESADRPVRNVSFEGLRFMYTTWMRPSTSAGHADAQNNHLRYPGTPDTLPDAAVMVQYANTVNFTGNHFSKLGITALRMDTGVQNSLIQGNAFYDISGGAVNVGLPDSNDREVFHPADPRKLMKNNDIQNNLIHDIGVEYKSAAAISAGYPVDMDISHNEIYSIPYSGTHIGYGWAKDFDPATRRVKIQNNIIYDLMGMGLRDGGAIYSLGTTGASPQDKNMVSGNYIRNQMDASGALYADEASAYWRYESNVIDLSESPPWHSPERWALAWAKTIHDLDFHNNYTTDGRYTNNGTKITFTDTHVHPDANWPAEAREIIDRSGLLPEYEALTAGRVSRWSAEEVRLKLGGSAPVQLTARNGKDQEVSQEGSRMYFTTENPAVAVVDGQGNVTGLTKGSTALRVQILNGSLLRTVKTMVYVGDSLSSLKLEGQVGGVMHLREGSSVDLEGYGITEFGSRVEVEGIGYGSSRPDVAAVDGSGRLSAHQAGTTVLTLRGAHLGIEAESRVLVKVWQPGAHRDYLFGSGLTRAEDWFVSSANGGSKTVGEGQITIGTPGGHAIYRGRTYQNELKDFRLKLNGNGSWYALMFGNQDAEKGYSNGSSYLVTVSAGALELQRFNEGARTVIYGNIDGYTPLGGDAVPNTMLPLNEEHRIQLGAVEEQDGVRLILKVDGREVFNYLDTAPDALRGPGYFGLVSRTGSMTLLPAPEAGEQAPAGVAVSAPLSMETGEAYTPAVYAVDDQGSVQSAAAGTAVLTSSQPDVAGVDTAAGTVKALQPGTAVITAVYGGTSGSYLLTVTAAPDRTPPVTTDNAPDGWVNREVTVELAAADERPGPIRTYYQVNGGGVQSGTAVRLTGEGIHRLRYWSMDAAGNREEEKVREVRIDRTAPEVQLALSKTSLHPANHRMVSVTASVYASDSLSGTGQILLQSIVSSEPDDGQGDGHTAGDIQDADWHTEDFEFKLRAERSGSGPGRVYKLTYTAMDRAGNQASVSADVHVPRNGRELGASE